MANIETRSIADVDVVLTPQEVELLMTALEEKKANTFKLEYKPIDELLLKLKQA